MEAIRTDDEFAEAKIALIDAGAPDAGRIILAEDTDVDIRRAAQDALVALRLAVRCVVSSAMGQYLLLPGHD